MKCPSCAALESRVVNSRTGKEGDTIRRRRECAACGARFTTYERLEISVPSIVKADGRREPYRREKVFAGVDRACEKLPVSMDQRQELVERVEAKLAASAEREVPSQMIGDLVMDELKVLDGVAYLRFASVYRSFRDISEFLQEAQAVARSAEDTDDEPRS